MELARQLSSPTLPSGADKFTPRELLEPEWKIIKVNTAKQLAQVAQKLRSRKLLAIDTETVGETRIRGNDRLCVITIGDPVTKTTYFIHVVKLEEQAKKAAAKSRSTDTPKPIEALRELLENKAVDKIAHNWEFEREQFRRQGITLTSVHDTRKMAKLVRPDMPSHTLQACVLEIVGEMMSKKEQVSNWGRINLTQSQINYASLDAEIAYKLYLKLHEMQLRLESAKTECAAILGTTDSSEQKIKLLLTHIAERDLEQVKLLRSHGIYDAYIELLATSAAYKEKLRERLKESYTEYYRGPQGVAETKEIAQTVVDLNKLEQLLPDIYTKVVREKVSRASLQAAVAKKNPELSTKQLKSKISEIWEAVRVDKGRLSNPSLIKTVNNCPNLESEIAKAKKLVVVPDLEPAEILAYIMERDLTRLRVLRELGIANEISLIAQESAVYTEAALLELSRDPKKLANSFENSEGSLYYERKRLKETDLEQLKKLCPEAIEKTCSKTALTKAIRELGADPQTTEELLKKLLQDKGEKSRRTQVRPNYSLFYKGLEEPEDLEDAEEVEEDDPYDA